MFGKKILVMKQMTEGYSVSTKAACGICRLEKEDEVLTVCLSLIGFSALPFGEYRLYVIGDDKTVVKKVLGKIPASCTHITSSDLALNKGVSAGIWTVKDDIPLLVAYRKSEDATLSVKDYGTAVINDIITERKIREREKEFIITPDKQAKEVPLPEENIIKEEFTPLKIYNDEAVATENYYDVEDEIKQKLSSIKEMSDEYIRFESDGGNSVSPQEEQKSKKDFDAYKNETGDFGSESATYYDTVKAELDGIFNKYPNDEALEKAISGSRFAKVYYAENKFYVVGLIKENEKEKYICYGVPSAYRETPPKELAGYCSFIPLSIFDLKGDGYFMMFQDAISGRCVRKA